MHTEVYKPVTVRGLTLGTDKPKICVPLTAISPAGLEQQLKVLHDHGAENFDLIEWRVDMYAPLKDCFAGSDRSDVVLTGVLAGAADLIRQHFPDMPLLFTLRTSAEGGNLEISTEDYIHLNAKAASLAQIDLIDVEYFSAGERLAEALASIHACGKPVVLSSHDFTQTPASDEMYNRMLAMQRCGADIVKLAVMPETPSDVLRLMEVTLQMKEQHPGCPLITMSMGRIGAISRLSGALTGTALTFAAAAETSAPGQMPARMVREVLNTLGGTMV